MRARFFLAPFVHRKVRSDGKPAVPGGLCALNIGILTRSRERIWS
jgi:hypothetical protein